MHAAHLPLPVTPGPCPSVCLRLVVYCCSQACAATGDDIRLSAATSNSKLVLVDSPVRHGLHRGGFAACGSPVFMQQAVQKLQERLMELLDELATHECVDAVCAAFVYIANLAPFGLGAASTLCPVGALIFPLVCWSRAAVLPLMNFVPVHPHQQRLLFFDVPSGACYTGGCMWKAVQTPSTLGTYVLPTSVMQPTTRKRRGWYAGCLCCSCFAGPGCPPTPDTDRRLLRRLLLPLRRRRQ